MSKKKYRVKPGCFFGRYKEHGPGTVVELSDEEAIGVLDKLEAVDKAAPAAEPKTPAKTVEPPAPKKTEETEPEIDPVIAKVAEIAGLESPEELSLLSDEDLLATKGIGRGLLKRIRQAYPYQPDAGGES